MPISKKQVASQTHVNPAFRQHSLLGQRLKLQLLNALRWHIYVSNWIDNDEIRRSSQLISCEDLLISSFHRSANIWIFIYLILELIILNCPVILSHRRSTTFSLENYPPFTLSSTFPDNLPTGVSIKAGYRQYTADCKTSYRRLSSMRAGSCVGFRL